MAMNQQQNLAPEVSVILKAVSPWKAYVSVRTSGIFGSIGRVSGLAITILLTFFWFPLNSSGAILGGKPMPGEDDPKSQFIRRVFDSSLVSGRAYPLLRDLCKKAGHRLSGSEGAARAVLLMESYLQSLGLDCVWLQPVMVPRWVRGAPEQGLVMTSDKEPYRLRMLALGGSVGTGPEGVRGELIEFGSLKELEEADSLQVTGRVVFLNKPFDQRFISSFGSYGGCIDVRFDGARLAASKGAVGVLIRSLTHTMDTFPHTGSMQYGNATARIPAAAVSTVDAEWISKTLLRLKKIGQRPKVEFKTSCVQLPDTLSYNVIGDWYGSERPRAWMVVGGHLDSWDVGEGAQDDGAGCAHSVEAIRLLRAMGYRPRRSMRVVLFMNEENGTRGAAEYARWSAAYGEKQWIGLESDRGGFAPREFSSEASAERIEALQPWLKWLEPYGVYAIRKGGSGVDVGFLRPQGTELYGLVPESQRYFDYHHAATDVFESVNRRELELGAASMASLLYLLDQE
jgi:hypothetical protein